jgi:predicted  nucleic acid-binding Zn-ribbon protein
MAKELSIKEKLTQLFELQVIDSKIDSLSILKGELPIEVSDLEDEIEGLNKRIDKLKDGIKNVETEVSRHQGNIKDSEALIAKYEKQMDNVKNNREFTALSKEVEMQKLEIELSNKRIGESGGQTEIKKEALSASKKRLKERTSDLDDKKVELDKIIKKTEKEERKLTKQGDAIKVNVEPRLIKAYDRLRNNYRNGLAVVTIERNACGGCFNRIPPQLKIEIGMRKAIQFCEHCSRILVDDEIAGKEAVEA